MIHKVKLKLSGGFYEIVYGKEFSVKSFDTNHLVYEEDEVWYVVSDPNGRSEGNSTIVIPCDFNLKSFIMEGTGIALKCDTIKADTVYLDFKNSAGEINNIYGGRIGISMGKGDVRVNIKELDTLKIDCGHGTVNVELPYDDTGYDITSNCGMGEVTLNSMKLPRQYAQNDNGKIIYIVCGMGNVNINTYMR